MQTDSWSTRSGDPHASETGAAPAVQALFAETVALFHRLRVLADQLHGQGELTASRRGILFELDRFGPRTVPQMARARPVARQQIQSLVDKLIADGLVELDENPAHQRSRQVRLGGRGKVLVDVMNRREADFLARLPIEISRGQLEAATTILRALREVLERPSVQRSLERTVASAQAMAEPSGRPHSSTTEEPRERER